MTSSLIDHPLREALTNEVHARPFMALLAPDRVSHLAMVTGEGGASDDRAHLTQLCEQYRVPPPPAVASHFVQSFGAFRLRWERHSEFCGWTFFAKLPHADAFVHTAIGLVPADWLAEIPGQRLVATHVALDPKARAPRSSEELETLFVPDFISGSEVAGGAAQIWTDFRIHDDGFGRILIQDHHLTPRQAGRLTQRLLEIETYRMMALLGLAAARSANPRLLAVNRELAAITPAMQELTDIEGEQRLLKRFITLATEIEQITVTADYRFGATRAYYALVERRIAELRETRIEGLQTIHEFMERRLSPAVNTCTATSERLRNTAERLTRSSTLLRTRVDIERETQNQQLLSSMARRARLQLRLQSTVEGLSIAAISYYLVGLAGLAIKGARAAGLAIDVDVAIAISIPVILLVVWQIIRRVRMRIMSHEGADPEL